MKSGVEDQALSCHHSPPTKRGEGGVDVPGAGSYEPLENDTEGVTCDTPGGDQERPEVDCITTLERVEDFEVD